MVIKKKTNSEKKGKKKEREDESVGMGLDDAFGGDEDIEYGESKPKKEKKKKKMEIEDEELEDELDEELDNIERKNGSLSVEQGEYELLASKPIEKIKKGDKIKIDGNLLEVDAHYVLMDHGNTKEMVIELFDENERDYQIRYFSDQVENTMEFYELKEIMYLKRVFKKIEF